MTIEVRVTITVPHPTVRTLRKALDELTDAGVGENDQTWAQTGLSGDLYVTAYVGPQEPDSRPGGEGA